MAYKLEGGKLPVSDIQALLKQCYSSKPTDYKDYTLDKELSGKRVQVYKKNNSPQTIVVHRGTEGIQDMGNDLKYVLGFDISKSKRAKYSQNIQKKSRRKIWCSKCIYIRSFSRCKIGFTSGCKF